MGLVVPQKARTTWNGSNKQNLLDNGYKFTKLFDEVIVDIQHLTDSSSVLVLIQCDYCNDDPFLYPYNKYFRSYNKAKCKKISCSKLNCRKQYKEDSIIANNLRFPLKKVKGIFRSADCEFLDNEYKGYSYPHHFRCICGKKDTITMDTFKNGRNCCLSCSEIRSGIKNTPYSLEEVKNIFTNNGCIPLFYKYKNNTTPLDYICRCGNQTSKTLQAFRECTLCVECIKSGYPERGRERAYKQEEVERIFISNGCKLISNYKGFHKRMNYICECGETSKISLEKFLRGQRCRDHYLKNNRGPNNPAYNPNKTDEEREYGRILDGLKSFKNECRKRDNWTCRCCGKFGGELHVHHIFSYSENPLLRIEVLNGITLCYDCHKGKNGFHTEYTNKNFTENDFQIFIESNFKDPHVTLDQLDKLRELYSSLLSKS